MFQPSKKEFVELAQKGNIVPVWREILADLETPVSAFLKLAQSDYAFLLESVEGGEHVARYSFLGTQPLLLFRSKDDTVLIEREGSLQVHRLQQNEDPLHVLKNVMGQFRFSPFGDLPRFCGGFVGYIGYDMVRFFERLPDQTVDDLQLPDCYLMLADTLVIFDHLKRKMRILVNASTKGDPAKAYDAAIERIDGIIHRLRTATINAYSNAPSVAQTSPIAVTSNFTREGFETIVERAKEYIAAGDIIQVVLSQRFQVSTNAVPFNIYRALRSINPSPYMFYLSFGDLKLIGSSPEILVSCFGTKVVTRPLAGTRPRGRSPEEDEALEKELLADPKERAEHIMLVDLGRNDLGRVCKIGTVKTTELMQIERYSHVMHIYSTVEGELDTSRYDVFDALRATFPAGTVTGAPKIRAMEIIEELEPTKRGPYAGSVGYFSFNGNMDMAITIRTIVLKGNNAFVQAGAGIVADSVPEREFQETVNKAKALLTAIEMASQGLE
ncbi:MAG: anthranilate synthase component I [Armatimonadota bacterium]|nr:anthranilate synthase component I [Armatimonadota bacterium]MDW8141862.1 anthranilate synthase component I [Armatimonadota bacterium]